MKSPFFLRRDSLVTISTDVLNGGEWEEIECNSSAVKTGSENKD